MEPNDFDKAARYAARLDAQGFLRWLLRLPAESFLFREWLDTRTIVFPGEADRTCDTVARVENLQQGGVPWAIPIEFQFAPHSEMIGRLLEYLGKIWRTIRPDRERGSRYWVASVVVNLTGEGNISRTMEWQEAGLMTRLNVVERNLFSEDVNQVLDGIAEGSIGRCILPWIPLMHGGDEVAMIDRWKQLAEREPDGNLRGDYGALALIFAEASGCQSVWKVALREWNMVQSQQVLEWKLQGRMEGHTEALIRILRLRFGSLPMELDASIQGLTDLPRLDECTDAAVTSVSFEAFRKLAQL